MEVSVFVVLIALYLVAPIAVLVLLANAVLSDKAPTNAVTKWFDENM